MGHPASALHLRAGACIALLLVSQTCARAQFQLSEILAVNQTGLTDEEGEVQDWIEVRNGTSEQQTLGGWALTDDANHATRWQFPDITVEPNGYRLVFASGKNRKSPGSPLHASFKLKATGEFLALLDPRGIEADAYRPNYPRQRNDISYGRTDGPPPAPPIDYLAYPTPGHNNTEPFVGRLTRLTFSVPHGLFESPITVGISSGEPDVIVHYTLDGSTPDAAISILSAPLSISRTTVLRARGFQRGHTPTPVATASYIFPRDRLDDSADGLPPEGYPWTWGNGKANYGLDEVVTADPEAREQFVQALYAIPSVSLVTEVDALFSDERGNYAHAGWHGRKAERPASVELLPMAGREAGFQVDAGVRMRGGSSRAPRYMKHGFRLFFRKQYGPGKLKYDLFHGAGAREFDGFDLRCTQQYSWHHGYSPNALYVRDPFARDTQIDMGHPGAQGAFVHLYINGHRGPSGFSPARSHFSPSRSTDRSFDTSHSLASRTSVRSISRFRPGNGRSCSHPRIPGGTLVRHSGRSPATRWPAGTFTARNRPARDWPADSWRRPPLQGQRYVHRSADQRTLFVQDRLQRIRSGPGIPRTDQDQSPKQGQRSDDAPGSAVL